MKKKIMNIRPQEVTIGGERSVQYKGSDGKMHEVASAAAGILLSVEELTKTALISFGDGMKEMTISDFLLRYGASKITGIEPIAMGYQYTQLNKIYFDNSNIGTSPFYYDLSYTELVCRELNYTPIDSITRNEVEHDMPAVKDFFIRTITPRLGLLSPYHMYYFMKTTSFVASEYRFTYVERHLIGTEPDGTRHDYGVIQPNY